MNNTQRLRKGPKEVQNLGPIADTILLIEMADALERRLDEVKESHASGETSNGLFTTGQIITVLNTYLDVINPERQKMYAD